MDCKAVKYVVIVSCLFAKRTHSLREFIIANMTVV